MSAWLQTRDDAPLDLGQRVSRTNTLPVFITLVLVVAALVVRNILWRPAKFCATMIKRIICCGRGMSAQILPAGSRKFLPGFTSDFVMAVYDVEDAQLSAEERSRGWMIDESDETGMVYRVKVWPEDGEKHRICHKKGQRMKTWEVIRENSVYTYDIHQHPLYADAVQARDKLLNQVALG